VNRGVADIAFGNPNGIALCFVSTEETMRIEAAENAGDVRRGDVGATAYPAKTEASIFALQADTVSHNYDSSRQMMREAIAVRTSLFTG
jgi:hypothetical protein